MGYGGTGYATVNVDIAQTDVDAIVQGITGYYGRTLTDVDNDLGNYLYSYGYSAAELLYNIYNQMGYMGSGNIENYLSGNWYGVLYDGNSVVSYLNWINSNTGSLQGYLAGWNGGPLTNIDNNTSYTASNTSYLYNIDSSISTLRDYLYDWNSYQSVAAILNDIRNLLQQFSFDGSGRMRVNTTG